eukprot:scaffold17259_cov35-Tisochrysis_lutea.AAC.1
MSTFCVPRSKADRFPFLLRGLCCSAAALSRLSNGAVDFTDTYLFREDVGRGRGWQRQARRATLVSEEDPRRPLADGGLEIPERFFRWTRRARSLLSTR